MPKFEKGHAKKGGRRRGQPNVGTERARRLVSERDDKEIVQKVIAASKAGQPEAQRLYFRHLRPPAPTPKETFLTPVVGYTAPKTAETARSLILELGARLAGGQLSVEGHDSLVAGLKAFLTDAAAEQEVLIRELDQRLEELRSEIANGSSRA